MSQILDPTFYRSPADAIAAPPERLAYVAAFDPAGKVKDAMTVIDCDPSSPDYGKVVGWSELPTAGNELHHFGWNAQIVQFWLLMIQWRERLARLGHGVPGQGAALIIDAVRVRAGSGLRLATPTVPLVPASQAVFGRDRRGRLGLLHGR
jgi:hypothetical protein